MNNEEIKKGDGVMRKMLRGLWAVVFVCVLSVPGGGDTAWGATVSLEQARLLAENWLDATTPPLEQGALWQWRDITPK